MECECVQTSLQGLISLVKKRGRDGERKGKENRRDESREDGISANGGPNETTQLWILYRKMYSHRPKNGRESQGFSRREGGKYGGKTGG